MAPRPGAQRPLAFSLVVQKTKHLLGRKTELCPPRVSALEVYVEFAVALPRSADFKKPKWTLQPPNIVHVLFL